MERQVPPNLSKIYAEMDQLHKEHKDKAEKDKEIGRLAAALYDKARTILGEYGEEIKIKVPDIHRSTWIIRTPSVTVVNGDTKLEFSIEGDHYEIFRGPTINIDGPIRVLEKKEGEGHFGSTPFFVFERGADDGRLRTPLGNNADPGMIEAASTLLEIIQESLSERQTPRSQQVKPADPKRGLTTLFRRLMPGIGKP